MGSQEAMRAGAVSRYDAESAPDDDEPEEGVVSKVPAIGSVHKLLRKFRKNLIKTFRDHLDVESITDLHAKVATGEIRCVRHSPASMRERGVHDVTLL